MPKWLKIVLILVGVMLFACGLCGGGAFFWFNENKEKLKGVGDKAKQEGAAFAYRSNSEGCVDEALRRVTKDTSIVDQAGNKIFLKACLDKTERAPGFCDDVPPRSELIVSAKWAVERCVEKGRVEDQVCARLMQVVQEACQPKG